MRKTVVVFVAVLLSVVVLSAKSKKDSVDPRILSAKYIYITDMEGRDVNSVDMDSADREAIAHVETALRKWNRFFVRSSPSGAELYLLVRAGRRVSVGPRIRIGSPMPRVPGAPGPVPDSGSTVGIGTGAEFGAAEDTLMVVEGPGIGDTNPNPGIGGRASVWGPSLWRASGRKGLGPNPMLVERFRRDVEEAVKQQLSNP